MLNAHREDEGFTVIEMAVTMMIASIIMVSLFGLLDRGSKSEVDLQQVASSQQGAREAMGQILGDLRSADPLELPYTNESLDHAFQFSRTDMETGAKTEAMWHIDADGALVRVALDPVTHLAIGPTYRLVDVSSISFSWWSSGAAAPMDPALSDTHKAACAVHVTVQIVGASSGKHLVSVIADAALRNANPQAWC